MILFLWEKHGHIILLCGSAVYTRSDECMSGWLSFACFKMHGGSFYVVRKLNASVLCTLRLSMLCVSRLDFDDCIIF